MCAAYAPRDPVGEFWRGEISLRELRVLVEALPLDSAVHKRDPRSRGWTATDHLLADLSDEVGTVRDLVSGIYTGAEQVTPGEPRRRPGDEEAVAARVKAAKAERTARAGRVREIEAIALGRR